MAKNDKTNVMRILDQAKIPYSHYTYEHREGEAVDGLTVAASMNQPPERVFKTLVTRGAGRDFFVFVIPVACELDLKAAAHAVGEKSVEMIHVAEINKVTGYIGRLFADRDEEAVPHGRGPFRAGTADDHFQRRAHRFSGGGGSGGP